MKSNTIKYLNLVSEYELTSHIAKMIPYILILDHYNKFSLTRVITRMIIRILRKLSWSI